jgi:hypothetical protein
MVSRFFFRHFVTTLVASIDTRIATNFMFHIRCIFIRNSGILNLFQFSFAYYSYPPMLSHLSVCIVSLSCF